MTTRYEVKGLIAQGGIGEVYLAWDTELGREVALKRVKPQDGGEPGGGAGDLLREARTLSALQHPNIVTVYDAGRDAQGPFVVMEYLNGETLDAVVERGPLSAEDFREVVLQVMEGMVAAQAKGLVHRDLKPGNVMVNWLPSGRFQVKILDFGLARFSRKAEPQTRDQGDGIFGSIHFMAPEQFERQPLDARTDLYALGCIFYQVLAQRHPFEGETAVDVMVSHLQHRVIPLGELRRDVPGWMAGWVMWLISRGMEERPADARMAMEYFQAGKSGLPPVAGKPVPDARPVVAPGPGGRRKGGAAVPAGGGRPAAGRVAARSGAPRFRVHGGSLLSGILVVAGGLGIFYFLYREGTKPKADPGAVLTALAGPSGTPDTVRALVALAAAGGGPAAEALEAMRRVQGKGVAGEFAAELVRAKPPLRGLLVGVVAGHPCPEGVAALWQVAQEAAGDLRLQALDGLGQAAGPGDLPGLLAGAGAFSGGEAAKRFWETAGRILAKESDRDDRVKRVAPALAAAGPSVRPGLYRLLASCGSAAAQAVLATEVAAGGSRQRSAVEALPGWNGADPALAEAFFEAAKSGDRELLAGAGFRVLARVADLPAGELVAALRRGLPLADTVKSRAAFMEALGSLGSPEALAFARELAEGPDAVLAAAAKPVVEPVARRAGAAKALLKGENTLDSADVIIAGPAGDASYSSTVRYVTGWRSAQTRLAWDVAVPGAVTVEVEVLQSALKPGQDFLVRLGRDTAVREVAVTKHTDDFVRVSAGRFALPEGGHWRLWIEPGRMTEHEAIMNIRSVFVRVP